MSKGVRSDDVGRARLPNDRRAFAELRMFAAPDQRRRRTRRAAGLQRLNIWGVVVGRARLPNDRTIFAELSVSVAPDQRRPFARRAAGLQRFNIWGGLQSVVANQGFSARRVLCHFSALGLRISSALRGSRVDPEPRPTNRLLPLTTSP